MQNSKRILLFFVLPALAPLLYPPDWLGGQVWIGFALAVLLFVALGFALMRGRSTALTLSIFLQGLNVIIRLMMFFPHAAPSLGVLDIPFIIASLLSIGLSMYILLRLDQVDVRVQMVH
jgi:hypothetical protein